MSWRIAGRSGVWPYADIAAVRLSYRPVSMQSRRFRADIGNADGARIAILSTSWQTAALMAPQDRDYRAFIDAVACAHGERRKQGGAGRRSRAARLCRGDRLRDAGRRLRWPDFSVRSIATGEWAGALFLVGFAALFAWQVGGFVGATGRWPTRSIICRRRCCRRPASRSRAEALHATGTHVTRSPGHPRPLRGRRHRRIDRKCGASPRAQGLRRSRSLMIRATEWIDGGSRHTASQTGRAALRVAASA